MHQIPLARVYAKGLDLIHLEESMSWTAEPSEHLGPLSPRHELPAVVRPRKPARNECTAYPAGPRWRSPKIICTTCARRERDCSLPIPDISSRTLLARAPRSRRSGATQANSRVLQRPQATRGGLMIGHVVAFLDGREPNTSPPGGRLEEASTACQLNRIRRA